MKQQVMHRVEPGWLRYQPLGSFESAVSEDFPVRSHMFQFKAFGVAVEHDRVLTRHVTFPGHLESDLSRRQRSLYPGRVIFPDRSEVLSTRFGQ